MEQVICAGSIEVNTYSAVIDQFHFLEKEDLCLGFFLFEGYAVFLERVSENNLSAVDVCEFHPSID